MSGGHNHGPPNGLEGWRVARLLRKRTWRRLSLLARRDLLTAWSIVKLAVLNYGDTHSVEAAAGLAYYATFTLFPLLLFLIVFASSVLESESAKADILSVVTETLPAAQNLVVQNVEQVLRLRGTVGVLAGLSLLWSASGFFVILTRQVGRVWPDAGERTAIEQRMFAFGIVGGLAMLLAIWLSLSASAISRLPEAILAYFPWLKPHVVPLAAQLVGWLFPLVFLVFVYHALPKRRVGWVESIVAALVATGLWRAVTAGLVWYLGSGLSRYQLIYGSLSSMMVLMFWLYLCGQILLLGASLCAAISMYRRSNHRHWVL